MQEFYVDNALVHILYVYFCVEVFLTIFTSINFDYKTNCVS